MLAAQYGASRAGDALAGSPGADANKQDVDGSTALMIAAQYGGDTARG